MSWQEREGNIYGVVTKIHNNSHITGFMMRSYDNPAVTRAERMVSYYEEVIIPEIESPEGNFTWVYFVASDDHVKIGRSQDVTKRMKGLITMTPFDIELIGYVPGTYGFERYLHRMLAPSRHRGEWFRLTPGVRDAVLKVLVRGSIYGAKRYGWPAEDFIC